MADALAETTAVEDAALWQVDLADIAKQVDLPTDVLLDALITSTANAPGAPPGAIKRCALPEHLTLMPPRMPRARAHRQRARMCDKSQVRMQARTKRSTRAPTHRPACQARCL